MTLANPARFDIHCDLVPFNTLFITGKLPFYDPVRHLVSFIPLFFAEKRFLTILRR